MPYRLISKGEPDDRVYTAKQLAEKLHVSESTIANAARNHAVVRGCLVLRIRPEGEPRMHRRKCRVCGRWFMGKEKEWKCLYCRRLDGIPSEPGEEWEGGRMLL